MEVLRCVPLMFMSFLGVGSDDGPSVSFLRQIVSKDTNPSLYKIANIAGGTFFILALFTTVVSIVALVINIKYMSDIKARKNSSLQENINHSGSLNSN